MSSPIPTSVEEENENQSSDSSRVSKDRSSAEVKKGRQRRVRLTASQSADKSEATDETSSSEPAYGCPNDCLLC
jgi:hypothetical protein